MTVKPSYPANNQAVTITLDNLANGSVATSSALDNSSNLYDMIGLAGKFKTNAAGTSSTGTISVAIAASADGGTTYPTVFANCRLVDVVQATANATTYVLNWSSIAALFGGVMPSHYKVLVQNNTGAALDNAGGNNGMWFEAEQDTVS